MNPYLILALTTCWRTRRTGAIFCAPTVAGSMTAVTSKEGRSGVRGSATITLCFSPWKAILLRLLVAGRVISSATVFITWSLTWWNVI